jgi:hypothetical protein
MKNILFLLLIPITIFGCVKDCQDAEESFYTDCELPYDLNFQSDTCYNIDYSWHLIYQLDGNHYEGVLALPGDPNSLLYTKKQVADEKVISSKVNIIDLCERNLILSEVFNFNNRISFNRNIWISDSELLMRDANERVFIYDYISDTKKHIIDLFFLGTYDFNKTNNLIYFYGSPSGQLAKNYIMTLEGEIIDSLPDIGFQFTDYKIVGEDIIGLHVYKDSNEDKHYEFARFNLESEILTPIMNLDNFSNNVNNIVPDHYHIIDENTLLFASVDGIYKLDLLNNSLNPIIETKCDSKHYFYLNYFPYMGDFTLAMRVDTYQESDSATRYAQSQIVLINHITGEEWVIEGLP